MSNEKERSVDRPNYSDTPETPTGIWVIGVVGLVGAAFSVLASVSSFAAGAIGLPLATALAGLGLVQAVTMLALVGLTPWAWYATIGLYTLGGVAQLVVADGAGALVSFVVVAYVGVHKDLFEQ